MNKLALMSTLVLSSSTAFAQDSVLAGASLQVVTAGHASHNDEAETLSKGRFVEHSGFYLAPTLGVTSINDDPAPMFGARGAWLVNHRFGVGLAFAGFSNDLNEGNNRNGRVEGGYGGLLLQYIVASSSLVHGFFDTTLGGGAVCMYQGEGEDQSCGEHGFFLVEPTANIEINVAENVRLTLGGGYRAAIGERSAPISDNNLSGFVTKTSVEFGLF